MKTGKGKYLWCLAVRRFLRLVVTLSGMTCAVTFIALAQTPRPEELQARDQWFQQHLLEASPRVLAGQNAELLNAGIEIWEGRGGIEKIGSEKRVKIGTREYSRGFSCPPGTKLMINLPSPGQTFEAVVGVGTENDFLAKGGSVFSLMIKERVAFRSDVLRANTTVPYRVTLGGATEFTLNVSDAGENTAGQTYWANAKVTLTSGRTLWLSDLPIRDWRLPVKNTNKGFSRLGSNTIPFSFVYNRTSSDRLLPTWSRKLEKKAIDSARTQYNLTWRDSQTGLEVRCVAVAYADYPVAEWTVYFKNTGQRDTPVLEWIQGLDVHFERMTKEEFVLRTNRGDYNRPDSYQPLEERLKPGIQRRFAPEGGRPSNRTFPYFNLQIPGGGVIFAVGWPGQWAASFLRDQGRGLRVLAGQELTHLSLKPDEEIRTPLVALLFWKGESVVDAQNLWRRWFMAHIIPRPGGQPPAPLSQVCTEGFWDFMNGIPEMQLSYEAYTKAGVEIDYYWRDAGWYVNNGTWKNTGTWEPDPKRFPLGFKPFADWLHARGSKFILWFEPERVTAGTWLAEKHPEWVLKSSVSTSMLLNLGDPQAWKWVVQHIDKLITEWGVDLYRQDFNMDPLANWRANDAAYFRAGMTENLYVQGYLAFWDELQRRHPEMLIDSCASGGRRNDLETLRRSVPLLRSDYQGGAGTEPGIQGHTFGISSWIPYYGTGVYGTSSYTTRSYYVPAFGVAVDPRKDVDWPSIKKAYEEWREIAPFMLGDYYPLTRYSLADNLWIAWQFNRPENGDGMVQAFRRRSSQARQTFHLQGLNRSSLYEVMDFDTRTQKKMSGKQLVDEGLTLTVNDRPGAAIITYKMTR